MPKMMHLFRKYQYILLVVFGVLLMFVFIVGDALPRFGPGGGGGGGGQIDEAVVLTWKNGRITDRELRHQFQRHRVTMEFLQRVAEETTKRGETPRTDGILPAQTDRDVVRNILLAEKATSLGLKVDNAAVKSFLYQFSDKALHDNDFAVLIKKVVGSRISEKQLMEQLQQELLAQHMFSMLSGGLRAIPPREAWSLQDRMQRRVKTEMVAFNVVDFKDKVVGKPSEQQIKAMYEEGKDRFSHPTIADFGFRKRRRAAFEYVRADFSKFQDEEVEKVKPEVTDEDIEKYYEDNKERYRALALPDVEDGGPDKKTEGAEDASKKPEGSDEKKDDDPDAPPKPEGSDEAPKKPAEGDEKKKDSDPAPKKEGDTSEGDAEKPADPKPEDATPESPKNETPEEKSGDKPSESKPDEKPTDSSEDDAAKSEQEGCFELQEEGDEEGDAAESAPAEEAPAEPAAPTKEAPAKGTDDPPKPANDDDAPPAPAEKKPSEEKAGEGKPVEPAAKTDEAAGASKEKPAESTPEKGDAKATEPEKEEPKYKPLDDKLREEIRADIAKDRARKPAQDRLDAALKAIESAIDKYGRELRRQEFSPENEPPAAVDFQALAGEHGMTAGKTDLVDPLGIEEYELGKAYQFSFAGGQFQQIPFAQLAYGDGQLYSVKRIRGSELDVEFLYWKTAQEEGYVPELDEVRDEIVDAWKKQKAFVLAKSAAEDFVKELGDKKLSEAVAEREELQILETPEFSWMTRGFAGFGGDQQPPSLSTIEGVESAGNDFMRDIFSLDAGETGVAVNQPETHVYVVHILSESPSEEIRRETFLISGITPDVQGMAMGEFATLWQSWYADLEREMQVEWNN